jgi:hypothetical protein
MYRWKLETRNSRRNVELHTRFVIHVNEEQDNGRIQREGGQDVVVVIHHLLPQGVGSIIFYLESILLEKAQVTSTILHPTCSHNLYLRADPQLVQSDIFFPICFYQL